MNYPYAISRSPFDRHQA